MPEVHRRHICAPAAVARSADLVLQLKRTDRHWIDTSRARLPDGIGPQLDQQCGPKQPVLLYLSAKGTDDGENPAHEPCRKAEPEHKGS